MSKGGKFIRENLQQISLYMGTTDTIIGQDISSLLEAVLNPIDIKGSLILIHFRITDLIKRERNSSQI